MAARAAVALLLVAICLVGGGSPAARAACAPRVDLALESIRDDAGAVDQINVRVTAASTVAGGDRLVRVRLVSTANAR